MAGWTMRFLFWHHDVQGPITLESLWEGTHGFAASVGRLRILFWLAARGHEVWLFGNVVDGRFRGVEAASGSACLHRWNDSKTDRDRTVMVTLVPPSERLWASIPENLRRRTIYWANNPFNPIWIERARRGELLRVVCISHWHRENYRIYDGFDRVELGFHGIDVDLVARATPARPRDLSVLFCSVPRRTKGIHNMLRAWPFVREAVPEARLRIAGSARMHDPAAELGKSGVFDRDVEEEFAHLFGSPERTRESGIELLGTLGKSDVFSEMKASALVVVNCNWRGGLELSCLTAVEAQTAGIPVVGPARGGLLELIDDGKTGLLVHRADVRSLAEAIAKILKDPKLRERMGRAGPSWVRSIADYDIVVPQWEALVQRALAGEKAPHPRRSVPDTLRRLGYGRGRRWVRDRIRNSALEQVLLRHFAR